MRHHRLSGPHRADLVRGVVANREYEVEFGRAGQREFVPSLTAQTAGRDMRRFELLQCFGAHLS